MNEIEEYIDNFLDAMEKMNKAMTKWIKKIEEQWEEKYSSILDTNFYEIDSVDSFDRYIKRMQKENPDADIKAIYIETKNGKTTKRKIKS